MRWSSRASFPASAQGFVAIDLETTGLSPRVDRVVEVAVIQLDRDLSPCGELVTLINPGRHIGATHIHGITARDVVGAPRFEQVAPMLLDVLRGRVVVAHNVQFDLRFLHAEFARIGIGLPEIPVMCTMQLAPQFLRGLPARSLAACCDAAGVALDGAHAAAVDARAVAGLLACYARADRRLAAGWAGALGAADRVPWPTLPPVVTRLMTREIVAYTRAHEVPFLARLVRQLPRAGTEAGVESYLAVLDTVLEDRRVTATEAESLRDLAQSLGVGADAVIAAHQAYLRAGGRRLGRWCHYRRRVRRPGRGGAPAGVPRACGGHRAGRRTRHDAAGGRPGQRAGLAYGGCGVHHRGYRHPSCRVGGARDRCRAPGHQRGEP